MSKTKGRVTLPSESNFLEQTKEMLERWGADALRDSDGTKLDDDIKSLDAKSIRPILLPEGTTNLQPGIWMSASRCTLCPAIIWLRE